MINCERMNAHMAFKIGFDSAFPVKDWLGFQAIFKEKKDFHQRCVFKIIFHNFFQNLFVNPFYPLFFPGVFEPTCAFCMMGSYASLSVCLSVCMNLTKNQTG